MPHATAHDAPMNTSCHTGLMWFRRDLRVHDNAALHHALRACRQVHCVFVFDRAILDALPHADRRVEFIRDALVELDEQLRRLAGRAGAGLIVRHAAAADEIPRLAHQLTAQVVLANHDHEPAALERDAKVRGALGELGVSLHTYKDHVIFECNEVRTIAGQPYSVFTPYKKAWLAKLGDKDLAPHDTTAGAGALADRPPTLRGGVPTLQEIGFTVTNLHELRMPHGARGASLLLEDFLERIDRYGEARDHPAIKGPSYLGVHLRFGTMSIREAVRRAHVRAQAGSHGAQVWLGELVWREFFAQVLANFPHVSDAQGRSHSFRPAYDAIRWEGGKRGERLFAAWCEGRTGYPLVDAAMAQLNQTGYMHNRLRMVAASFLCKDLGVDWRRGERYFAEKLNDYELASNNGGWQWVASSGCDAQPYFRIFHPVTQSRRFDAAGKFILHYLPQLAGLPPAALHAPWEAAPLELAAAGVTLGKEYPAPIVDHAQARERTLQRYAVVRTNA
jgi:deoxyribodipyrimidine photo-lyase